MVSEDSCKLFLTKCVQFIYSEKMLGVIFDLSIFHIKIFKSSTSYPQTH